MASQRQVEEAWQLEQDLEDAWVRSVIEQQQPTQQPTTPKQEEEASTDAPAATAWREDAAEEETWAAKVLATVAIAVAAPAAAPAAAPVEAVAAEDVDAVWVDKPAVPRVVKPATSFLPPPSSSSTRTAYAPHSDLQAREQAKIRQRTVELRQHLAVQCQLHDVYVAQLAEEQSRQRQEIALRMARATTKRKQGDAVARGEREKRIQEHRQAEQSREVELANKRIEVRDRLAGMDAARRAREKTRPEALKAMF